MDADTTDDKGRARYKVAPGHRFYDNAVMHEAGDDVFYDGEPGENLLPLNAAAKKAKAKGQPKAAPEPLP